MGVIAFDVDGQAVDFSQTFSYRGIMNSGIPNMAMMFGYLRTSWTMRVDLVCDFVCRLLNHMDSSAATSCTPSLRPEDADMPAGPWVTLDQFNPAYMQRGLHLMPRAGDREPWRYSMDYYTEKDELPAVDLTESALVYATEPASIAQSKQA